MDCKTAVPQYCSERERERERAILTQPGRGYQLGVPLPGSYITGLTGWNCWVRVIFCPEARLRSGILLVQRALYLRISRGPRIQVTPVALMGGRLLVIQVTPENRVSMGSFSFFPFFFLFSHQKLGNPANLFIPDSLDRCPISTGVALVPENSKTAWPQSKHSKQGRRHATGSSI